MSATSLRGKPSMNEEEEENKEGAIYLSIDDRLFDYTTSLRCPRSLSDNNR